jgi:transcriptional regulator with XRE-family HTH domain
MGTKPVRKGPIADRVTESVRTHRLRRGLSHRQLSARLAEIGHPILPSGIAKIEDGSRRVDVDDLVALALALRVPLPLLLMPASDTGQPVELTEETNMKFTDAWRWVRGELLPGAPPKPDGDGWVRVDDELLNHIHLGHPDLFDQGPLSINEYQTHLTAVLHARVGETENVRFRPRKRGEKAQD